MSFAIWMPVLMTAAIGFLLHLMPRISRPEIFFTVTVAPSFLASGQAAAIRRNYLAQIWGSTQLAVGVSAAGALREHETLIMAGMLIQTAGAVSALIVARRQALPFAVPPSPIRIASLGRRDTRLPGGWPLQLVPYLIIAASAVVLYAYWEQIPDRFPVHWGVNGQPDRFAAKSLGGVFGLPITAFVSCLLMTLLAIAISRSRRVSGSGAAMTREARHRRLNLQILTAVQLFIAVLFSGIAVKIAVWPDHPGILTVISLVGSVGLVAGIIVAAMKFESQPLDEGEQPVGDNTPDEAWKFGLIYYNKQDPAFLVEKRFGFGYTVNFANPLAWLLLLGAFAPAIIGRLLSR